MDTVDRNGDKMERREAVMVAVSVGAGDDDVDTLVESGTRDTWQGSREVVGTGRSRAVDTS